MYFFSCDVVEAAADFTLLKRTCAVWCIWYVASLLLYVDINLVSSKMMMGTIQYRRKAACWNDFTFVRVSTFLSASVIISETLKVYSKRKGKLMQTHFQMQHSLSEKECYWNLRCDEYVRDVVRRYLTPTFKCRNFNDRFTKT